MIFIPISTLNYVGVKREKFNQVAGISNFTRNVGGAVGVSLLSNFIVRQGQIQRTSLASHANYGNPFFTRELHGITANLQSMGAVAAAASHRALAQISAQIDLQASVLAFVNAFWVMGVAVLVLTHCPLSCDAPPAEEAKQAEAHISNCRSCHKDTC